MFKKSEYNNVGPLYTILGRNGLMKKCMSTPVKIVNSNDLCFPECLLRREKGEMSNVGSRYIVILKKNLYV